MSLTGMIYVMPCPEEWESSEPVHNCASILRAPQPDGSCWRCGGLGFVEHDGDPTIHKTELQQKEKP